MENKIKTYIRKPETVKAIQFTKQNIEDCKEFVGKGFIDKYWNDGYYIRTTFGLAELNFGNYIIKSSKLNSYIVLDRKEFLNTYQLK